MLAVIGLLFALGCAAVLAGAPDPLVLASPFAMDPSSGHLLGFAALGSIEQLRKLVAGRGVKVTALQALQAAAAAREDGAFTAEERTQIDALTAQITGIDADIARTKATMEAARGVDLPDNAVIATRDNVRDSGTHGFSSFGEFAIACIAASAQGATPDPRLQTGFGAASTAPTSYGNEGGGADGGYIVPTDYSQNIVSTAYNENDSFVPDTDNTPVNGNGMTFPVDETTPWGSAGIKAYWTTEGGAGTDSKSKFDPAQLRLKKLTAMVPLTEEMLSDSAAIGSYVSRKVPEAIAFKTNEALWGGDGVGKPKGYYTSTGLLVVVAKETSQVAGTIVAQNISKMRARMSARSWRRACWCVNSDALPQLDSLVYATAATNGVMYKPEGGKYGYGTLLGRDVRVTDFNETVGSQGDIVLCDWGMYRTITKSGGVETATSMHFWFDRGITAFRTVFRIDGQPAITTPVTPNKGANTLSPIVALAVRS